MFAACVAHEINNPLTAVTVNIEIVMKNLLDLANEAAAMAAAADVTSALANKNMRQVLARFSEITDSLRNAERLTEKELSDLSGL